MSHFRENHPKLTTAFAEVAGACTALGVGFAGLAVVTAIISAPGAAFVVASAIAVGMAGVKAGHAVSNVIQDGIKTGMSEVQQLRQDLIQKTLPGKQQSKGLSYGGGKLD